MRRLVTGCLAVTASIVAAGSPAVAAAAPPPAPKPPPLANSCFALRSAATGRFVAPADTGYRTDSTAASGFYWKPVTLRGFLPPGQPGTRIAPVAAATATRANTPGPATAWRVVFSGKRTVVLRSLSDGRLLGA